MHKNNNACHQPHHAPPDLEARTQISWAMGQLNRQVKKLQVVRMLFGNPDHIAQIVEDGMHGTLLDGVDVIIADLLVKYGELKETIDEVLWGKEVGHE